MTDVIIIGAGTAGLSAAIYLCRAGKSVLIFEKKAYGGQIINTPDIENYPGIKHISGFEFATGLYEQATDLGSELKYEEVTGIKDNGSTKTVETDSDSYECKAIILATGAKNRPLGLSKESELTGMGISYCATCDGMFFRGKDVAVNGGGNTALEDAAYLAGICTRVYVIHRRDEFRGDQKSVKQLEEKENVEFVLNSTVTQLIGDKKLNAIEVTNKLNKKTREIPVSALFIAIGQNPDNAAFKNVADLDEKGYIDSGEDCRTKTPGIFTAGDCRTKEVRQLTTAAADGSVSATAAIAYLNSL